MAEKQKWTPERERALFGYPVEFETEKEWVRAFLKSITPDESSSSLCDDIATLLGLLSDEGSRKALFPLLMEANAKGQSSAATASGIVILGNAPLFEGEHEATLSILESLALVTGDGNACRKLGEIYRLGRTPGGVSLPKDNTRAFRLFERGAKEGYSCAIAFKGISLFEGTGTPQSDEEAANAFSAAAELGCGDGLIYRALALASGSGIARDSKRAIEQYRLVLPLRPYAAMPLAIRTALGLGCDSDVLLAADFAELAPQPQRAALQALVAPLLEQQFQLFLAGASIGRRLVSAFDSDDPEAAARIQEKAPASYQLNIARFLAGTARLSELELAHSHTRWRRAALHATLTAFGYDAASVRASMLNAGPVINQLDEGGFPVPFASKVHRLSGIRVAHHRRVMYGIGCYYHALTPLDQRLSEDDIDVALMLSFIEKHSDSSVYFSLEEKLFSTEPAELFSFVRRKVFSPHWIQHTDFGRSLYWADAIMPTFGHQLVYSLIDPLLRADEGDVERPAFYDRLAKIPGTDPYNYCRNAIQLGGSTAVVKTRKKFFRADETDILYDSISMYFDSSYIGIGPDGQHSRSLHHNDIETSAGASAAVATRFYDEIAAAYPVFDRVRSLLVLTRSLMELRQNGWSLAEGLEERLTETHQKLRAKPNPEELVFAPSRSRVRLGCFDA